MIAPDELQPEGDDARMGMPPDALARLSARLSARVLVPVLPQNTRVRAWPGYDQGARVEYTELRHALRAEHAGDAHFAAYSAPSITRRLDTGAVGRAELPEGVPLVAFVADVDHAETHAANVKAKASKGAKVAVPETWREEMRAKVEKLRAEHPGFVAYETRGGFRVLSLLATPRVLRGPGDVESWRRFYAAALAWLHREYGITGDPACADWTRLFRLPRATREGSSAPENLPMHGDEPGPWTLPEGVENDPATVATLRDLAATAPAGRDNWNAHARRLAPPVPRLPTTSARSSSPSPAAPSSSTRDRGDGARRTAWARSVLAGCIADMTAVQEGQGRNAALYEAALRSFRAAMGSSLSGDEVFTALQAADGGAHPDTDATLESARAAATREGPAAMPDRPRPGRAERGDDTDDDEDDDTDTDDEDDEDTSPEYDARGRVVIKCGPSLQRMTDRAVMALHAHPDVFQFGTLGLCRVIIAKEPPSTVSERERERRPREGDAIIEPVTHPALSEMLDRVASFMRREKKKGDDGAPRWRKTHAPPLVVSATLARKTYQGDEAPRVLRGLIEAPAMRADGTVISAPGYDAATGLFLQWDRDPVDVPEAPTHDEARAAYRRVRRLFASFHYQGDEFARETMLAAVVAAMLTPMVRVAMGDASAPGFMISASDVSSGKSTVAKACGAVVLGRTPAASQYTADDDEMSKRAASVAATGRPLWFIDNVRANVEGSTLEMVLTCDGAYEARVLGTNVQRRMAWTATVYMTANGASYSRDMARRVRHIALRPHETAAERDAVRDLDTYDLVGYVLERRPAILRDLLTITRAHYIAGRPRAPRCPRASSFPFESFDAWERWCADPIWWASGYSPAWSHPPDDASRDTNAARATASTWWDAIGEAPTTTAKLLRLCNDPPAPGAEPRRADAVVELAAALAELVGAANIKTVSTRALGRALAQHVVGRSWEHGASRVTIAADGVTGGVARFRARREMHHGDQQHARDDAQQHARAWDDDAPQETAQSAPDAPAPWSGAAGDDLEAPPPWSTDDAPAPPAQRPAGMARETWEV